MDLVKKKRLDKTAFEVVALHDADDDYVDWHSRTAEERLAALEWMRQVSYGHDSTSARLQRVLTIARLGEG